ncbi:unnamed protein product [Paramecium pentaurelia]|uniref:Uncharacterized protein n=1 Tax=Paramecium pentaurelia TaxID=43138 RepID=A0A8S1TV68_9CILI|nr:unnamed protein product [Paramecium pentaurelia]
MNSFQQNKRVCIAPFYKTEYEVYKWAQIYHRFLKVKIQVQINQNQIIYSYQGEALKSLLLDNQSDDNNQLFYNLEQIRNLDWKGLFGKNNQKTGFWNAYWNQQKLELVGGYLWNGSKIGNWIDLFQNYFCQSQVFEIGEYQENKKKGRWKYTFENIEIGGGSYFSEGEMNNIKIGKWIDLDDEFRSNKQVTYNGEYKFGKKVGRWDIYFRNEQNNAFQLIGGGFYDERGDGFKNGRWIELDEEFNCNKQVIFIGVYNNGKKIGKWDIWFRQEISQSFTSIGGGLYDEGNDGVKIGKWIDLDEGFYYEKQVTYNGEYKNGKKVGRWDIFLKKIQKVNFKKMGGGTYDQGIKKGQWIDLDEWFYIKKYVTWKGKYENGRKCGEWDIRYLDNSPITIIGGGTYGLGIKSGQWTDLEEQFNDKKQAIHKGKYQNGKKVGRWDILYRNNQTGEFTTMQNILYKVCNQNVQVEVVITIKVLKKDIGLIQRRNLILKNNQLLQVNMKMVKKLVNGINFNIMNNKNIFGRDLWSMIYSEIKYIKKKISKKQSIKGNRKIPEKQVDGISIVEINNRNQLQNDKSISGGGLYDEGNDGMKIGKWIDLDEGFYYGQYVTYNGEYKNGKKVGRWDILYRKNQTGEFTTIGGGNYDEGGIKIGEWTDLVGKFDINQKLIIAGKYENGKKIGQWDKFQYHEQQEYFWQGSVVYDLFGNKIYQKEKYNLINSFIQLVRNSLQRAIEKFQKGRQMGYLFGGGLYDERGNGIKRGLWIDLHYPVFCDKQVFIIGEYKNGKKTGKWRVSYNNQQPYIEIGYGYYAENGNKIGQWNDLYQGFNQHKQITYKGEYRNGHKIGRWDIYYRDTLKDAFIEIGGGLYDEGDSIKIGKWIDLDEGFNYYKQVTYKGFYVNGKKVGRWDIEFKRDDSQQFSLIGGGLYDLEGSGEKIGSWIELDAQFDNQKQETYIGVYNNGQKVGFWDLLVYYQDNYYWQDSNLYDIFENCKVQQIILFPKIVYKGKFKNCKKFGRWDIEYRKDNCKPIEQIGGGSYDEEGNGVKIGQWIEVDENFNNNQTIYDGYYNNGQKVGVWVKKQRE